MDTVIFLAIYDIVNVCQYVTNHFKNADLIHQQQSSELNSISNYDIT